MNMEKKGKSKSSGEKQKYADLWDKHLRLQAEFDNYRKRSFKEKTDFIKFANESLIIELLSILDNFERGIKSAEQKKDYALLHQGVDMISKQLHNLLETKGLSRISSLGQKFDPHQHEAVEVIEGEDTENEVVVEELQPGYTLSGRVIRPTMVKVTRSRQGSKTEKKEEEQKKEEKENKEKEQEYEEIEKKEVIEENGDTEDKEKEKETEEDKKEGVDNLET